MFVEVCNVLDRRGLSWHLVWRFQQGEVKAEETKQEPAGESPAETAEVTTPTEATTPASTNTATSPDSKETKKKDKVREIERERRSCRNDRCVADGILMNTAIPV